MGKYISNQCVDLTKRLNVKDLDECFYFPKYLTIETSNNCNARCIMCPKGQKGTKNLQLMNDSVFDKIIAEVREYSDWIEMICLNSDGEPLLDKGIGEKIKRLKEINIKHVFISTNAALLSENKILELLESGLDDIRISLDGFTKETYEKVRRGLNYDIVKANTLNLIRMRDSFHSNMAIRIRMVELEENAEEREAWLKYWGSQVSATDRVQLMPMHTWSGTIAEEEKSRIEYYSDKPCISVFSSCAINYNGMVQLCDSDIEQQEIMGSVIENSIKEIWQGEKFELFRNYHINAKRNNIKICQGCDHWSREFKEIVI